MGRHQGIDFGKSLQLLQELVAAHGLPGTVVGRVLGGDEEYFHVFRPLIDKPLSGMLGLHEIGDAPLT
jgi:hypothetical protein